MSPLESLVMAIVQKKLVDILDNKNNRFKIGCLSSFESLQASVYNKEKKKAIVPEADESESADTLTETGERVSDIYVAPNDADLKEVKRDVPDMGFVDDFAKRYKNFFNAEIPHPKVDFIVKQIADRSLIHGEKFVVFTRRINTVDEITRRLNHEYDQWLREHVRAAWNVNLEDISKLDDSDAEEMIGDDVDSESEEVLGSGIFTEASQKGGWLFRYRQTFRESGRNSLMFEENWFRYFSEINNIPLDSILEQIPDELWAESRSFANRQGATKRAKILPADRFQYLVAQVVKRFPHILGLDAQTSSLWLNFFAQRYHDAFQQAKKDQSKTKVENLVKFKGFWDFIRERIKTDEISKEIFGGLDSLLNPQDEKGLFKREIAKNCIWQGIRLTDALIDLRCADVSCGKNSDLSDICERYLGYLLTTDQAKLLRKQSKEWIDYIRIIIANCFSNEDFNLSNLASRESYTELRNPRFAVGMTGGNPNKTALSQFKTPGYPRVIVCTDILKEGEDLHLFCDQVVHYGIAWTSGDLEQRVGRVDRYFSLIERRLSMSNDPENEKLNIFYPHILKSIEKYQIERVLNRVKDAEQILDDIGLNNLRESKEVDLNSDNVNANPPPAIPMKYFEPRFEDVKGYKLPVRNDSEIEVLKNRYQGIYDYLVNDLRINGYSVEISERKLFTEPLRVRKDEMSFDCLWDFVPCVAKYALRIGRVLDRSDLHKSKYPVCEYRRLNKKEYQYLREHRVFIDDKVESSEMMQSIYASIRLLENTDKLSRRDEKSINKFAKLLREDGHKTKITEHACEVTFQFQGRSQNCKIRTYDDLILISSVIGKIEVFHEKPKFWDSEGNWSKAIFNEWVYDENARLKFGYLSIKDDELRFSERVFSAGLNEETINKLMAELAHLADGYEVHILGEDLL